MNVSLATSTLKDPTDTEIAEALLSRERAILGLYQRLIEQCKFAISVEKLQDLKFEHQLSVASLQRIIQRFGATPGKRASGLKEMKGIPFSSRTESGRRQSISMLARAEECLGTAYDNILETAGVNDKLLSEIYDTLLPRVESSKKALLNSLDEEPDLSAQVALAPHHIF